MTLAHVAALVIPLLQDIPPEYERRLGELNHALVQERLAVAQWLQTESLHEWARMEYEKILGTDPHNQEAREALGYTLDGDRWVRNLVGGSPLHNAQPAALIPAFAEEYWSRLDELGRAGAARHLDLAIWCRAQGQQRLALDHARIASAHEPTNAPAAQLLGWSSSPLIPVPNDPEAVQIIAAARAAPAEAPPAEHPSADQACPWPQDEARPRLTAITHGPHVHIESSYLSTESTDVLLRAAEHSFRTTELLLPVPRRMTGEPPIHIIYLRPDDPLSPITRGQSGTGYYDNPGGRTFRILSGDEPPIPHVAHHAAQLLVSRRLPNPREQAWVWEGAAVLVEWLTTMGSSSWCVGGPVTGSEGHRENYRATAYAVACQLADRPFAFLLASPIEQLHAHPDASKAPSILEWLACRYRDRLVPLLSDLLSGQPLHDALWTHLRFSPAEFDEFWRRWARAAYREDAAQARAEASATYRPSQEWCACWFCRQIRAHRRSPPHIHPDAVRERLDDTAITQDAILVHRFGGSFRRSDGVLVLVNGGAVATASTGRRRDSYCLDQDDVRRIRRQLPRQSQIDPASFQDLEFDVAIVDGGRPRALFAIETLAPETWSPPEPTQATLDRWSRQALAGVLLDAPLHVLVPLRHRLATIEALDRILRRVYSDLGRSPFPTRAEVDSLVWPWEVQEPND